MCQWRSYLRVDSTEERQKGNGKKAIVKMLKDSNDIEVIHHLLKTSTHLTADEYLE